MEKEEQMIMVVEKEILFTDNHFQGFQESGEEDFENVVLDNYKYMRRGDAEKDPTHKQPIAYSLIINPISKKVFAYRRARKDEKYSEQRLQGKWSWGVGGHIERIDIQKGENPIYESMKRELYEEIQGLEDNPIIRILGYVNDDAQYDKDTKEGKISVGRVHFGILYLIETRSGTILPFDEESETGNLMNIGDLEKILKSPYCTVETWSRIAFNPLKNLLVN